MGNEFEALSCQDGVPTDCCKFAVVSRTRGKEVCRVWEEDDAKTIAHLLNQDGDDRITISLLDYQAMHDAAVVGHRALEAKLDDLEGMIRDPEDKPREFYLADDIPLDKDDIVALRNRARGKLNELSRALNTRYASPMFKERP